MNDAASAAMRDIVEINLGYGVSDEYRYDCMYEVKGAFAYRIQSFVFDRSTQLFGRRER